MKEIACCLYEAYCEHTGWKSLATGQDLPQWSDLRPDIKEAWRAVERAATEMLCR